MKGFIFENEAIEAPIIPIVVISQPNFNNWLQNQTVFEQEWLIANDFAAEPSQFCIIPNVNGAIAKVIYAIGDDNNFWDLAAAATSLPKAIYRFDLTQASLSMEYALLAWGLASYQFERYKKAENELAELVITENKLTKRAIHIIEAVYLVRDLINTSTEDMGPDALADIAESIAKKFRAKIKIITGEKLLKQNYPTIYTVGRAGQREPRLIDLRWGHSQNPKVTLVGKGVCFDTGGLDLKSSAGMALMKKDMGGAAHVLALAQLIMTLNLPINLRVLIPAVENNVSHNAYRPSDVIKTRKGITVEVGNTDAEGRLILCDALAEACNDKPNYLIDFATLTGAARVALGPDLPVLFSNNDEFANALLMSGEKNKDRMWRLPLHAPYKEYLKSYVADINNSSNVPMAGAITAALYLQEFVEKDIPWVHLDLYAWNMQDLPGRPLGGEAMTLRAVLGFLEEKFNPIQPVQ